MRASKRPSRMNEVFSDESAVLMLGPAINLTEATIEDLVPRKVYTDAVKHAGHRFTLSADEKAASTNVKAMGAGLSAQRSG